MSATIGALLAGSGVYASTNLASASRGSSGEARVSHGLKPDHQCRRLPVGTNALYPGGTGDAVVTIYNPNPYPVTITAVISCRHDLCHRVHVECPDYNPDSLLGCYAE